VTEAGSVDLTTTFHVDDDTDLLLQPGFHLEEQMRSYNLGLGVAHSFAEDNAVLAINVQAVVDAGACPREPTTVVDLTAEEPVLFRLGRGDPALLGLPVE